MNPLHRLPNGKWIQLDDIYQISPVPAVLNGEANSVTVLTASAYVTLHFAGFSEAQFYADELAALVNAARQRANAGDDLADAADAVRVEHEIERSTMEVLGRMRFE